MLNRCFNVLAYQVHGSILISCCYCPQSYSYSDNHNYTETHQQICWHWKDRCILLSHIQSIERLRAKHKLERRLTRRQLYHDVTENVIFVWIIMNLGRKIRDYTFYVFEIIYKFIIYYFCKILYSTEHTYFKFISWSKINSLLILCIPKYYIWKRI